MGAVSQSTIPHILKISSSFYCCLSSFCLYACKVGTMSYISVYPQNLTSGHVHNRCWSGNCSFRLQGGTTKSLCLAPFLSSVVYPPNSYNLWLPPASFLVSISSLTLLQRRSFLMVLSDPFPGGCSNASFFSFPTAVLFEQPLHHLFCN